jgi:hypothetical protein
MEPPKFMRRRQKNASLSKSPVETQPEEANKHTPIQCKDCGRWSKPMGVHSHKRYCKGKGE